MANSVGGLYVDLGLNSSDFQSGLRSAQGELQRFGNKAQGATASIGTAFAGLGRGLTAALGAAGIGAIGIATLADQVKRVVSEVSNLAAEAKMAGVAVETFQELRYAAQQAHVSFEALTDGLKELQLRADEFATTGKGSAAEAFQRIGYSAADLKDKLKDPPALFAEIIERIRELNKAAQIRVSDELFGGTGGEQFLRFLDLGRNSIARMRKEAQDTGQVLDEGMVKQAEEINRRFQALASTVDTTLKSAVLRLIDALRGLGPAMGEALNVVVDAPKVALAKTTQEVAGIRAQIDQLRQTHNLAAIGDLNTKLADAERRRDALAESVRELNRGLAMSGGENGTVLPPDGAPLPPQRPQGIAGSGVDVAGLATAAKAAQDLAKAYQTLIDSSRQRLADAQIELATIGMTTQAAAAYRFEQEAIAEATRNGITLTAAQKQELAGLAAQYGTVTGEIEKARDAQEQLNELRSAASGFFSDLRSGLSSGKSMAESFSDAVGNLSEKLLDMLQNKLLMQLFNSLPGFTSAGTVGTTTGASYVKAATGGAIRGPGSGTSDSIPAMLSNGEYVVNAASAKRYGAVLEAINSGRLRVPGFATGGSVGGPVARSGGGTAGAPKVTVNNYAAADGYEARTQSGGINGERLVVSIVRKATARGDMDQAQRLRFGSNTRKNVRG